MEFLLQCKPEICGSGFGTPAVGNFYRKLEKCYLRLEKRPFMLYTRNPFTKVLPSVTWKKVNESNKFMDLGKDGLWLEC